MDVIDEDGDVFGVVNVVDTLNDVLDTDIEPIYDDPRPGDVRHSHADITKAEALLDYEPDVGFEAGLEQTIPYYRTQEWYLFE